jgi:hypothetical protein
MDQTLLLASITALHLILTAVPGAAGVLLAARAGMRDVSLLLGVGMVSSGLVALLAYWCYFAAPLVGTVCAFAIVGVSLLVAFRCRRALGPGRDLTARLLTPVALWGLGAAFLVFLGFLKSGTTHPLATAMTRFSHSLTSDNYHPFFFSDALFHHGHEGPPAHLEDWLSSDRPPLQSGFVLTQRVFGGEPYLHYQILGVVLQQLWIVGLWSLLIATRIRAASRALVVIALLLSDVAIVNGFFVWPKLLSTAYLLASAAVILTEQWTTARRDLRLAALMAALFAFALLSHGGSIFGIIPLIVMAAARGVPTRPWIAVGSATGLLLIVPWSLYQRYEDPPGNRLIKWLVAGVAEPDGRTSFQAFRESYAAVGISGAVQNKIKNFRMMAGIGEAVPHIGDAAPFAASGDLAQAIRVVRADRFFAFLPSMGIFVLAPLVMLVLRARGRRTRENWTFALRCFVCVTIGCLAWGLLIFGPPGPVTVLHAGSYALPMLALAGCVAGLYAVAPQLAAWMVVCHSVTALVLYVPVLDPPAGASFGLFSWVGAAAAVVSLTCFAVVAFWSADEAHARPELPPAGSAVIP